MIERTDLLASIAATMIDYREGDLVAPTPDHVKRWVDEFDAAVQLPILREMDHVLKQTYFSRKKTARLLARLFQTEKLAGDDPCTFWQGVNFLNIQGGGASQREMLALFGKVLEKECGFSVDDCGADQKTFVYLDDAIFSGGRVSRDLTKWIEQDAPLDARLHIIVIAIHQESDCKNKVRAASKASGKTIKITFSPSVYLEDRDKYTDTSDMLRPVSIPADPAVQAYINGLGYSPQLRTPGQVGQLGIFSSDAGRQILEQEFLKAGIRIRKMCPNLKEHDHPLGSTFRDTVGFGSLIVTFRNCPNNAPLALWVRRPWYPLFPRKTNAESRVERPFRGGI